MYTCSKCKIVKEIDKFRQNNGIRKGINSWCKDCCKQYEQSRRDAIKNNIYSPKRKLGPSRYERNIKHKENLRWCWACCSWIQIDLFAVYPLKDRGKISSECNNCINIRSVNRNLLPKTRYDTYKRNAKYRNLLFNLTMDEFMSFWQLSCTYCDEIIETIGLDRIDNTQGYFKKNCIPCCAACNIMRNNQTQSEFIKRVKRITEKYEAI